MFLIFRKLQLQETTVGKTYPVKETPNTAKSSNTSRVRKTPEEEEASEEVDITLKSMIQPEKVFLGMYILQNH